MTVGSKLLSGQWNKVHQSAAAGLSAITNDALTLNRSSIAKKGSCFVSVIVLSPYFTQLHESDFYQITLAASTP